LNVGFKINQVRKKNVTIKICIKLTGDKSLCDAAIDAAIMRSMIPNDQAEIPNSQILLLTGLLELPILEGG
jgi:hypothetical protein